MSFAEGYQVGAAIRDRRLEEDRKQSLLAKSADYFMQAGGDEMYQQLGVTPDGWKNLSATDRVGAVQGLLQAQHIKEFMAEAKRKQEAEQQSTMEAGALQRTLRGAIQPGAPTQEIPSEFGPPIAKLPAVSPRFDPNQFMAGMAQEPALMRSLAPKLIPQMMREATEKEGEAYQFDPSQIVDLSRYGLPGQTYVGTSKGGGQIRSRFDPSEFIGQLPEGYTAVPGANNTLRAVRSSEPKTLPDSYNQRLDKLFDEIKANETEANRTEDEIKTRKSYRGKDFYTKAAGEGRQRVQALLDSYREQGYGSPEFWTSEYQRHGLKAPGDKSAGSSSKPATGKPLTATNPRTGEKLIYQDGQWKPLKP